MRANRLEPKVAIFVHGDSYSEPSMVLVSATKGGAEGMRILPPLFLYEDKKAENGKRVMSQRAIKIYDTMSFGE
jgi:tRNA1(Val) A37 N6-methylase TrmN6